MDIKTGLTSWASSIHLALRFAKSKGPADNAHVLVVDLQKTDAKVIAFHCPYLLDYGTHEYLPYGRVHGPEYVAVSYKSMKAHRLYRLIPDLESKFTDHGFGSSLREFTSESERWSDKRGDVAPSCYLLCQCNALPKEHNPHIAVMGIDRIENLRV